VDACLQEETGDDRYRLHDLVRIHAANWRPMCLCGAFWTGISTRPAAQAN
jgi:hypothetical protein